MITINAEFLNFSDVTVQDLHRAIGVYIIWEADTQRHPKYIGQGRLMERLARSEVRCEDCWEGLISIISYECDEESLEDTRIVENVILSIANDLGREPTDNQRVETRAIRSVLEDHNQIRISVSGRNPFLHPRRPKLSGKMQINVRFSSDGSLDFVHNFR